MSQLSKEPWQHPWGDVGGGQAEGAVESGVLIRYQRKDQACWGVTIKKGGSTSLRGGWAKQFSVIGNLPGSQREK